MKIVAAVKKTVLDLVIAGNDVETVVRHFHWTEELIKEFGVEITVEFVAHALQDIYLKHSAGLTTHAKKYANFCKYSPWSLGAMVGSLEQTSGAKIISFGRDNVPKGLPVSHADGFLLDKDTGVRRLTLECIGASDLRTGWFAIAFFNVAFEQATGVEVVIIGAGPVAAACIRMLDYGAASSIACIKVMSKSGKTNFELVERLRKEIKIPLVATNDRANIPKAHYVITAANAGVPVVANNEISQNAAVLAQGIDDLPADYIQRLIDGKGKMVGDDLDAMEQRNVDPLALFYSRQGKKLTVEGKKDGAITIGEIYACPTLARICHTRNHDIAFFPVGIMAYDIAVNAAVEKSLIKAIHEAANA